MKNKRKIKYIVLVPDGMADYPLEELGQRTPLEVARTPNMDSLVQKGRIGLSSFVPEGLTPGSDVANLAIFGYDPQKFYSGRASLEAANLGIDVKDDQIAFRCNFITEENNLLSDYSAGHITTKEAHVLIKVLNKYLANDQLRFYPGVSYRHLMVIYNPGKEFLKLKCIPPHDIIGKKISQYLPKGKGKEEILEIMIKSQEILKNHEINQVRVDLKENPANMIWLWGQGKKVALPSFKTRFNLEGSVISAVDLIKGIACSIGLEPVNVPGATGYYDTNYEAKAEYAIKELHNKDFVFVHVEAPDEAGHNGDTREKIKAIENFDRYIVSRVLQEAENMPNIRILICPDHPTPIALKTHTADPVCFLMYGQGICADSAQVFNEKEAKQSSFIFSNGFELMETFINKIEI
ncbi:MAG: cofactor-independent phosphoglycerate mutase [Candidatus Omnitrophota bacterium]